MQSVEPICCRLERLHLLSGRTDRTDPRASICAWRRGSARSSSTPSGLLVEQSVKADELVDERTAAGGGAHPVTVHAKMLRLELLRVKADLERSLGELVLDCADCGQTTHCVAGLGVSPDTGRIESRRRTANPWCSRRPWTRVGPPCVRSLLALFVSASAHSPPGGECDPSREVGEMRRNILLAVGAVIVLSVAGASALGSIPDGDGVVHSCYKTANRSPAVGGTDVNGQLRVIDTEAGQTCRKGETSLVWNQAGPTGPTGPGAVAGPQWFTTQVLADGSAFRSSIDGVTARKGGLGVYFVTFPRGLSSCEYLTTPTEGPIFAVPIAAYRYAGPPEELMVKTYDAEGLAADASFQLGVICYASF